MPESTAEKDSKPCRGLECLPALGSGKCWLKVMIPRLGGCCWGRQGHGGQAIPTQLGPTGPQPDWRGPLSPGPLHTGRGYLSASPPPPGSAPLCPGCPLPFPGTPCTPTPYLTGPWRTQIVTWEKQQQQQKPPLKVTITTTSYSENESEMGRIKHLPRT